MAPDNDDVDARFAELIQGNFGELVPERGIRDPHASKRPRRRRRSAAATADNDNPSSLLAAWDAADQVADDDEGRPAPLPPMGRWPLVVSAGTVLTLLGLVLAVLSWLGVEMAGWVIWFAGCCAFGGLGLLVATALRRKSPPRDDDGAVV